MTTPPVTVSVPPVERYARVLRLVASASGAAAGLAVDRLDDLKLAVDEAVGVLLDGRSPTMLSCALDGAGGQLAVRVTGKGDSGAGWPPEAWHDSLPALVLEGVASDVALIADEAGPGVTFRVG